MHVWEEHTGTFLTKGMKHINKQSHAYINSFTGNTKGRRACEADSAKPLAMMSIMEMGGRQGTPDIAII